MSCQICLEDYGKKPVVTCQYCPESACRVCQQSYLLQSYEDPHCMYCKRGWSTEFMADNFPLTFRGATLRKHRRKILVEREKSLLPSMQAFVEYKREAAKYKVLSQKLREEFGYYQRDRTPAQKDAWEKTVHGRYSTAYAKRQATWLAVCETQAKIVDLRKRLTTHESGSEAPFTMTLIAQTKAVLREKNAEHQLADKVWQDAYADYNKATTELRHASNEYLRYQNLYDGIGEAAPRQKREFIMKCADEDCRGFLSSSYKCGTCDKWTCSDCLVVIGPNRDIPHTCDAATVESAKAIKSETRGCPKCATRIFKIDGCDQMWCVMEGCGTAFSWDTGQIVTGKVHNPHYYEWQRRVGGGAAPREVGDIPCGGLPTLLELLSSFHDPRRAPMYTDDQNYIIESHRNINELIAMRLENYPAIRQQLANKDLDVAYLMKELTEEEWQRQLELSEARFNRKKEIGQILQTLATASSDIMRQIVAQSDLLPLELFSSWFEESGIVADMRKLRDFGNESLLNLAKRDRMAVPQLGEQWKWVATRAIYKAPKPKAAVA